MLLISSISANDALGRITTILLDNDIIEALNDAEFAFELESAGNRTKYRVCATL